MSAGPPDLGEAPQPLQPGDSFRRAARVAMWPQVARLLELEAALREPSADEDLKRYRVATRRLRAALRVFAEALPRKAVRDIAPELGDLARAVGRVRDLDVRIAGLTAWATSRAGTSNDDVEPLRAAWAAERVAAAIEMGHRLEAKSHARLLGKLGELVGDEDEASKRGARGVRDRAGSAVWAGFERLRSSASDLADVDLEALHDLRIRAKRLRYTLEFLAPVLGADRAWLVARLIEVQDHLGALNDADLAATATQAFLNQDEAAITDAQRQAIEAFAASRMATVEGLRITAPKAVATSASATFARRLSRAVLGPSA